MTGIHKRFGGTAALRGVDLRVGAGEVHALVGENGAGKSTLMKVLSGAVRPDVGGMTLDGTVYAPAGPTDARRRGVAMVYQELALAPDLTVGENVLLGHEGHRFGFLRRADNDRRVREALAVLGREEIHPDTPIRQLGPADRQVIEIARALLVDVRVLVLDEPTSSLPRSDVRRLFALVNRLRERGVSILYVSHFLEEVQELADRVTVLRDGQVVGEGRVSELSNRQIVEWMVGRDLAEQYPRVPHTPSEPVLQLDALFGRHLPRGVSLTLHRGEVLGLAGIVGAGRTELLRAVFGLDRVRSGRVTVKGVTGLGTPRQRIAQGLGLLSEDRKNEGLALDRSIEDNVTLSQLAPYATLGWLNLRRRRLATVQQTARLHVRCSGPEQTVGQLSGGNQQKVALARLLHQDADVLLLDEPTRGVDVGSKAEIYRLIGALAAEGRAVLMASSYLPELLGVCDRVAVLSEGHLLAVRPTTEWTAEEIMTRLTRHDETLETP